MDKSVFADMAGVPTNSDAYATLLEIENKVKDLISKSSSELWNERFRCFEM